MTKRIFYWNGSYYDLLCFSFPIELSNYDFFLNLSEKIFLLYYCLGLYLLLQSKVFILGFSQSLRWA